MAPNAGATDQVVLCFTGDGGFYYHLAELESARRCGIPVTVVVNNNSGFGQNLTGVRRIAGNRPGRGEALVRFGPTDFTAVARSFGVRGIRVEHPAELASALSEALAAAEPVVVDVVTDLEPRAPELWLAPALLPGARWPRFRPVGAHAGDRVFGRRDQPPTPRERIFSNTGSIWAR